MARAVVRQRQAGSRQVKKPGLWNIKNLVTLARKLPKLTGPSKTQDPEYVRRKLRWAENGLAIAGPDEEKLWRARVASAKADLKRLVKAPARKTLKALGKPVHAARRKAA